MKSKQIDIQFWILAFTYASIFSISNTAFSQKNYTKSGKISFSSSTPIENIEAVNKGITAILDTQTGTLQFSALIKGFEFEKALMQEHFNENYMESDKFPKANFTGMILENGKVNYTKEGIYPVKVKGNITIHGITNDLETSGKISISKGIPQVSAIFNINLVDYKINIPSLVADKIAKQVKVNVNATLDNVLK